jgi:hypothetical protein
VRTVFKKKLSGWRIVQSKNCPSEELSGEELSERRLVRRKMKMKNFPAKNCAGTPFMSLTGFSLGMIIFHFVSRWFLANFRLNVLLSIPRKVQKFQILVLIRNFVQVMVQIKNEIWALSKAWMACGLKASDNWKFQILALWYYIDQKFHAEDENIPKFQFWVFVLYWPMVVIRPEEGSKRA